MRSSLEIVGGGGGGTSLESKLFDVLSLWVLVCAGMSANDRSSVKRDIDHNISLETSWRHRSSTSLPSIAPFDDLSGDDQRE